MKQRANGSPCVARTMSCRFNEVSVERKYLRRHFLLRAHTKWARLTSSSQRKFSQQVVCLLLLPATMDLEPEVRSGEDRGGRRAYLPQLPWLWLILFAGCSRLASIANWRRPKFSCLGVMKIYQMWIEYPLKIQKHALCLPISCVESCQGSTYTRLLSQVCTQDHHRHNHDADDDGYHQHQQQLLCRLLWTNLRSAQIFTTNNRKTATSLLSHNKPYHL